MSVDCNAEPADPGEAAGGTFASCSGNCHLE